MKECFGKRNTKLHNHATRAHAHESKNMKETGDKKDKRNSSSLLTKNFVFLPSATTLLRYIVFFCAKRIQQFLLVFTTRLSSSAYKINCLLLHFYFLYYSNVFPFSPLYFPAFCCCMYSLQSQYYYF